MYAFIPQKSYLKNEVEDTVYPSHDETSQFTSKNLIKVNFIQTCSVMYRRRKITQICLQMRCQRLVQHLYHAQTGKIGFINKIMSVYRRHQGGVWWGAHKKRRIWVKFGMTHIQTYNEILKMYGSKKALNWWCTKPFLGNFLKKIKMDDTKKSNLIISESSTKHILICSEGHLKATDIGLTILASTQKQGKDINILHDEIRNKVCI